MQASSAKGWRLAPPQNTRSRVITAIASAGLGLVLSGCGRLPANRQRTARPSAATLSASGRTACSSCHDPRHDWGPPNGRPVQLAGPEGTAAGVRAVPSLAYAQDTPPFTEHFRENDGNDSDDQGPAGGRTWDGRAS